MTDTVTYQRILVAIDFSPSSEAALRQAIWLARQSSTETSIMLAHCLPDLREALLIASPGAQLDAIYGDGEKFQHEIRAESEAKLQNLLARMDMQDLNVQTEILLGDPAIALIHAVQKEKYDLVLAGTHGRSGWEQFLIGSVAKRLIRKCPAPVWIVRANHPAPPKVVLAATDFSEASRLAVSAAAHIARQANAELHVLHVLDDRDVPERLTNYVYPGNTFRQAVDVSATKHVKDFLEKTPLEGMSPQCHLTWGIPFQEIQRLALRIPADLLVLGTVGRSGIKGILLGNTAEKTLQTCDCNILTVKPADFLSPISPPIWSLHPETVH